MKYTNAFVLSILCLMMVGCGILFPPHYDSSEYEQLVSIAVETTQPNCEKDHTQKMLTMTTHLSIYSTYLPHNVLMADGIALLDESVRQLNERAEASPVSTAYCTLRMRVIHGIAIELTKAAGGKPK